MSAPQAFRRGDAGPAVLEVRGKLARLGLLETPDGAPGDPSRFDEAMDRAVRAFQQQRGITVDGVVGAETYRVLEEARWRLGERILTHAVSHPMTGDDVAALQRRLLDMGFDAGRVDGVLGRRTEAALRDFQRNVGLQPDGTCGPSTFKALARLTRTVVGGRPDMLREETALARSGPALSGKVVVVDPGHGGADRGVVAHGLDEASLVEDLAARIEGRLTATGVLAFLTRGTESGLDDVDRAGFANTAEADLLISLHVDAAPSPRAAGVATYYYGNDRHGHSSAVGERFAELVQREIVARTDLVDGRTHGKTWDLLRRTRMPAVRIELGYLTNAGDAARLADPGFRDVVAEAVVVAVGRLYLPPDDDAPTGTLRLPELARR
ncbi:N-acetylmuramoyl-L-alanine amidase [Vallicoccus soli]|uniref:N-acetylmuramoyl-L-alanine amidase n=1 Tax=Vallicoccus soli TaxID=2339232 RepID=A0A3A3Z192_9ACTN|nr:N-acetylmuramoyl-L-alanine amidase [Vallicoccus soli]RJK94157.1 N-acetylmuramoyl-L-alanine amidase [Vallicoccus soli]